jgi:hypothetical protein
MVLRAARGLRLGGIFGNQIKQVIAVDIVFTQRRRLADVALTCSIASRSAAAAMAADGECCQ